MTSKINKLLRYVNFTCIGYTSNFYNKSPLTNGTIRKNGEDYVCINCNGYNCFSHSDLGQSSTN